MNIFVLDTNPRICAQYHCDKHVVKMITESAQLLCSAYYFTGQETQSPYRLSHAKHPCAIWARESLSNWIWLALLGLELYKEFQFRYGGEHRAGEVIKRLGFPKLKDKGITQRPLAMPEECKTEDTVESYRQYYNMHKQHLFSWRGREVPYWIEKEKNE